MYKGRGIIGGWVSTYNYLSVKSKIKVYNPSLRSIKLKVVATMKNQNEDILTDEEYLEKMISKSVQELLKAFPKEYGTDNRKQENKTS